LLHLNHDWQAIIENVAYYNTFAASTELACGQPSQEAPKNIRDQPIGG